MKTCTNRIPDNCDSYECGRPEVRAGRCAECLPCAIAEARRRLDAAEHAAGEARARLRDLEGDTADHAKRLAEIEALAAIAATSPWTAWRLVRDHLPWLLAEHRAASEALAAAGIPDDGRGLAERVKALAAALGPIVAAIAAAEATPGAGEPW